MAQEDMSKPMEHLARLEADIRNILEVQKPMQQEIKEIGKVIVEHSILLKVMTETHEKMRQELGAFADFRGVTRNLDAIALSIDKLYQKLDTEVCNINEDMETLGNDLNAMKVDIVSLQSFVREHEKAKASKWGMIKNIPLFLTIGSAAVTALTFWVKYIISTVAAGGTP